MGEGYWSPTAAPGGEWHGVPGRGCWFRKVEGQPFWMTDGPHEHYDSMGAEGGWLGFPTSNFDAATGVQRFENGSIYWNGSSWQSSRDEPEHTEAFRSVEPPPPPPGD
ncbi:MAG: hypothetical protein ACRD12_21870 [Acidimicrobiales bacterium]